MLSQDINRFAYLGTNRVVDGALSFLLPLPQPLQWTKGTLFTYVHTRESLPIRGRLPVEGCIVIIPPARSQVHYAPAMSPLFFALYIPQPRIECLARHLRSTSLRWCTLDLLYTLRCCHSNIGTNGRAPADVSCRQCRMTSRGSSSSVISGTGPLPQPPKHHKPASSEHHWIPPCHLHVYSRPGAPTSFASTHPCHHFVVCGCHRGCTHVDHKSISIAGRAGTASRCTVRNEGCVAMKA